MALPKLLSERLEGVEDASEMSFPLIIRTGLDSLVCTELLRLLAAKRMVCKGRFNDETVLLKFFFGESYKRRWQREVDGVARIQQAGINTPVVLSSQCDDELSIAVIVFEFVEQAETLDVCLNRAENTEERMRVFSKALVLIAQMHNAGIYQRDVHLGNFLNGQQSLYLIDGDQVTIKKGESGLDQEYVINNLAMFFTQLYQWEHSYIEDLVNSYIRLRKQSFPVTFTELIIRKLAEYKQWREKKYIEKKVFRKCSAFDVIKNWNVFCVFSRQLDSELVSRFTKSPDELIDQGEVLKSGRTAIVAKIELNGVSYVLKRYNKKNWLHQCLRSLMQSRSAVSWKNGHLLEFNHIPTAKPLLMMENRWGVFRGRSYVLTEYIDGCHAYDYFNTCQPEDLREEMATQINKLVHRMHQTGFSHGDLKSHNIWVHNEKPLMIDLDGVVNGVDEESNARDWARLYRDLGGIDVKGSLFKGVQF